MNYEQFSKIQDEYEGMIRSMGPSKSMDDEHNDCTVKALSVAFEIPYDRASEFAKTKWKRRRRCGVASIKLVESFNGDAKLFGKEVSTVPTVNLYPTPNKVVECKSKLYTFAKKNNRGTYYVLVTGHALVIKDGKVLDGTKPGSTVRHAWKVS